MSVFQGIRIKGQTETNIRLPDLDPGTLFRYGVRTYLRVQGGALNFMDFRVYRTMPSPVSPFVLIGTLTELHHDGTFPPFTERP